MRIIKCDRCKCEHELSTAAKDGFREYYGFENNFHMDLCKQCVSDLYSFLWNQTVKPAGKMKQKDD